MEAFSLQRMKKMLGTFKKYADDGIYMGKQKFQTVFRSILTGEYMKFVCDQFKGDLNWREVCLGIALHPLYLLPETVDLDEQNKIYDEAYKGLVEDTEVAKYHLPKENFLECELFHEFYIDINHPKMNKKQIREVVWLIMEENGFVNYLDILYFCCDDFLPLKTLFNFFSVHGGRVNSDEISRFLNFKVKNGDESSTSKSISDAFGDKDRKITFREFMDSTIGKELFKSHEPYLTKKRIDDESDLKFQVVKMPDRKYELTDEYYNMYQLKSPPLFKNLNSSGYSSVHCLSVISDCLQKNPQMEVEELQQILMNETMLTCQEEKENELIRCVWEIAKNDRNSHAMSLICESIERCDYSFVHGQLLKDRNLLIHAVGIKIQKLDAELNDKEYTLSHIGVHKVRKFRQFFSDLLKSLEDDEEEGEGEGDEDEDDDKKKKVVKGISFNEDQIVEIKKEVLKSFVQTGANLEQIKSYILRDPLTEGTELVEFLTHPSSGLKISQSIAKNLIGYVTFNFKRTNLLAIYDHMGLMSCDHHGKELIMKIGYFLDLERGELDTLLNRAVLEVGLGMRPFVLINTLTTLESDHWICVVIRKDKNGKIQLLTSDALNGRKPIGNVISFRDGDKKNDEPKLHTKYIYDKHIKMNCHALQELKKLFDQQEQEIRKTRFINEVIEKMEKETKEYLPKFIKILNKQQQQQKEQQLEEDVKFKLWMYKFIEFWKKFLKKGTIRTLKNLIDENSELKKEIEELREIVKKLQEK